MDEKQARDTSKETLDQTELDSIENVDDLQDADNRDIASKNQSNKTSLKVRKLIQRQQQASKWPPPMDQGQRKTTLLSPLGRRDS
jgi:hypothetical protein